MESLGTWIGGVLLALVAACGWLLGKKANDSVRKFRSEQHESFRRSKT